MGSNNYIPAWFKREFIIKLDDKKETVFLNVMGLENLTMETTVIKISKCFIRMLWHTVFLDKMICFARDGTCVLMYRTRGIWHLFRDKFQQPDINIWHCLNHRIELTVSDGTLDLNVVNYFKISSTPFVPCSAHHKNT